MFDGALFCESYLLDYNQPCRTRTSCIVVSYILILIHPISIFLCLPYLHHSVSVFPYLHQSVFFISPPFCVFHISIILCFPYLHHSVFFISPPICVIHISTILCFPYLYYSVFFIFPSFCVFHISTILCF